MAGNRWSLWSVLLTVATSPWVATQIYDTGCPSEWLSHADHCYQFVFGQPKPYTEAAAACWAEGSALVSVNGAVENRFITEFLSTHARDTASVWYTSCEVISGSGFVKWHGDGSYTNTSDAADFWRAGVWPETGGSRLVYMYTDQQRTFRWNTVDGYDSYNFICEIPKSEVFRIVQQSRDFDYGVNTTDHTAIVKGPQFLLQPESLVVVTDDVIDDVSVVLECAADGNPLPGYTWYETSADFTSQTLGALTELTTTTDPRYTLTNGRLSISQPEESQDAAVYQCKAENQLGSILSQPVRLSFGYLNQYSPNTPGAVEAKRNQGSFINCLAPAAKPALSYAWYKGSVSNFIRPELDQYYFVSTNGNLYLSEVQDSAAGSYFCVVTLISSVNEKLSTRQPPSRTSKAIQLVVKNSPAQEYGPIIHPDFISVYPKPPMAGHQVQMECFAYGRLPLRYSWQREGREFPPGTYFRYDNRVLVIPRATLSDGGNYTCKVEKLAGTQKTVTKSFVLTLEAKPSFVVPLKNVHADVDSRLTWRCEVLAIPRATYSWYKNSELLKSVPGDVEIRENVLVIKRLNADRDNGMYQCMATNTHGTSVSTAQLRVLSIQPSFLKYPLPTTTVISQGGNLTIRCTPQAAPAPDITWLHNGQPIGYGGGRAQILLDGTLHVTQVTVSDSGSYTCKASNVNGEAQSSTRVSVFGGISFLRKPVSRQGSVNRTVFLACEISYDPNRLDLAYVWKYNGRTIDTKNDRFYRKGDANSPGLYIINSQFYHSGLYECSGQTVTSAITAAARVIITGPPGAPAGLYVSGGEVGRNGTTARLHWTWNTAANHGYPVTAFQVEARTDFRPDWVTIVTDIPEGATLVPNSPMRRYVDAGDLLPYNSYSFRVRAKNNMGVGSPSRPSELYRVPSAAPVVAPRGVGGGGGRVGLLCMAWQALDRQEEGGTGFGYIVYWRLASDQQVKPKQQDVGNMTRHCVTVGESNYYLLYEVKVLAYNSLGQGPLSPVGYAYSAEGMPANRPTNVNYNTINGTAMTVYWNPVPNTREAIKGQVLGYRIDYWDAGNPQGQSNTKYVYCSDCAEGLVVGLDPDSDYWLRVSVFNSAGLGVPSEKYLSSTNQYPAALYPQFVEVFPAGEHSVRVQWRGVSTKINEGALKGYKLQYWPVGDDVRTANFTLTNKRTDAVIQGLQQDVIYNLRVMAVNLGGDGKKSPTVFFTVLHGGAVNVNVASFDPATSQMLVAGAGHQLAHPVLLAGLNIAAHVTIWYRQHVS